MIGAVSFEAKLHALRRTNEGTVVSLVIHPSDVPDCLALDPLGQRYMVAIAAIDEDTAGSALDDPSPMAPLAASPITPTERGKLAYANGTPGEQARTRAAMLAKDERFIAWVVDRYDGLLVDAAGYIRDLCCAGNSRSLIASNPEYLRRFLAMETEYMLAHNMIPEPR